MFGFSPYDGVRLGKEIGQLVKFFGIGGVFHSDELPNFGIEESDLSIVKNLLKIKENDAFLIIAAPSDKIDFAIDSIINRIRDAKKMVPSETRLATQTGETIFLRPRPGASRMYPETDIPPIIITQKELDYAKYNIPKSWDKSIIELRNKYKLNQQLAEQIFDSKYIELFEKIIERVKVNPTFVASILCSTIVNLERSGLNAQLLSNNEILKSFELLELGKIAKESIEMIYGNIMAGKSKTIEEAIKNASINTVNQDELEQILEKIVDDNKKMIENQKERAMGPLMGIVMKELRGKVSGEVINKLLLGKIKSVLENN
jgi:glutamyl-tRNA(Gln) amidotransferase subunit E